MLHLDLVGELGPYLGVVDVQGASGLIRIGQVGHVLTLTIAEVCEKGTLPLEGGLISYTKDTVINQWLELDLEGAIEDIARILLEGRAR